MLYTDLIFILAIFPISAIISLLDRSAEYKNMIMIITSLLFFSWGRPFYVCLLFLTFISEWLLGLGAAFAREKKGKAAALPFVLISAAVNIALFLHMGAGYLSVAKKRLAIDAAFLPAATAFYTVRGFSYVYDTGLGKIPAEKNPLCLLTYMCAYPTLLAGPVVRYGDMSSQIRSRELTTEMLNTGMNRIVWGLAKCVLAGQAFEGIKLAGLNSGEITTVGCYLGMLAFIAQFYFVFTGLCDMSRGFGLVCGFVLPANYKDYDPDELFSGFLMSVNHTVTGFFAEMSGAGESKPAWRNAVAAIPTGLIMGAWFAWSVPAFEGIRRNVMVVGITCAIVSAAELLFLRKLMEKLPAVVKYIYIGAAAMTIFGGLYFESFYAYRKWLFALAGVGTKYTLSVAMKQELLSNLTIIAVAFVCACPHVKKIVFTLTDSIAAKSRRTYGIVRGLKTLGTAIIFVASVFELVVAYSGV
ncbi:MAG: acyltransferase [Ruminococcus sp.]|nr:acyltransferase [Ruminococcus sp.]